ncbi:MAG: hypothetical protein ABJN52_01170 [Litorimonas sp.]
MTIASGLGCGKPSHNKIERVILGDGLIDIPVIEGSFLTDDCEAAKSFVFTSDVACVAYPFNQTRDSVVDWGSEYLKQLTNSGWVLQFEDNQIFSLVKPMNEDCYYHMNMISWVQASMTQSEAYQMTGSLDGITNGVFLFVNGSEPICETKRRTE